MVWAVLTGLFLIGEVATAGLLLVFFAGGAAAASVAAALGAGTVGSAAVFAVVTVALIGLVRPVATRHLYQPPLERSGTAALIGSEALVLEAVDARDGRVKIGGEIWSARAADPSAQFAPGQSVNVLQIDGATAVVA